MPSTSNIVDMFYNIACMIIYLSEFISKYIYIYEKFAKCVGRKLSFKTRILKIIK